MRAIILALSVLVPAAAQAQVIPTVYRGLWGVSQKECNDPDGPNQNTFLDLERISQYETSCRLSNIKVPADEITGNMTCEAEGKNYRATFRIIPLSEPTETLILDVRSAYFRSGHQTIALIRCKAQPKK